MAPTLLGFRTYPILVVVAALSGVAATVVSARRAGLPLARLFALEGMLLAAAFAGAKLFWLWEMGALLAPWTVPFTLDGLRYPGGILALLLVLPMATRWCRLSVTEVADVLAAPIAVAMGVVRIGCLLQGCCFGPVSDLPWAIAFPRRSKAWMEHVSSGLIPRTAPASLPVHPLQIYFGLWSLAVAVLLFRAQSRRRRAGDVALLFLILHEGGKAALESLRVPRHPPLQLVSLALAVGAAVVWLVRRRSDAARPAVALPASRAPRV